MSTATIVPIDFTGVLDNTFRFCGACTSEHDREQAIEVFSAAKLFPGNDALWELVEAQVKQLNETHRKARCSEVYPVYLEVR